MLSEKYAQLDDVAAPSQYVVPPSEEDLSYIMIFRQVCKRYCIDFSKADEDERMFVTRMAEKAFLARRA